jgi:hypothetical protein
LRNFNEDAKMYQLTITEGGKVYSAVSGDLQPDGTEVSEQIYRAFLDKPFDKDAYYIDEQLVLRDKEFSEEELAAAARGKRDVLLAQCDWTQMPDVNISNKTAWAEYRQQLRAISSQAGFPREIAWPVEPK